MQGRKRKWKETGKLHTSDTIFYWHKILRIREFNPKAKGEKYKNYVDQCA